MIQENTKPEPETADPLLAVVDSRKQLWANEDSDGAAFGAY